MTDLVCPICGTKAKPLDRISDATGFECLNHGRFRVADAVKASPTYWNASGEKWERALLRARSRHPDAWAAIIKDDDFDDYG
jgi:hypothetical protein